jgi:hypothetical protein
MIPSRFAHVSVAQKPYTPDSLGQALAICLTTAGMA